MSKNDLGQPEQYYTIELEGAQIAGTSQVKRNTDNPDNDWSRDMVNVYFTCNKLTREFPKVGIGADAF
jgi:type VI protein secretion system component Hcp